MNSVFRVKSLHVLMAVVLAFALVGNIYPAQASAAGTTVAGQVAYYHVSGDSGFLRSTTPLDVSTGGGSASQTTNVDGTVSAAIANVTGYADSGFSVNAGPLGNLNGVRVASTGDEVGLNLWFDVNGNNEFFAWNGGSPDTMTGLDGDEYSLGPTSSGGLLEITGSSQFVMMAPGSGTYTLNQLKAGAAAGISASTHVALWIGVCCNGSKSTTVSSLTISTGPLTDVYVDGTYSAGNADGHFFGVDAFATIQEGVNAVASGGTVHVAAGTYVENVTITTPLTLAGAGQASTTILPAISDPNCGGAGGGSLCATGGSYVILVQANNVTIHDLTIDGDNPALTSAYNVGTANLDARDGIITNHTAGVFNGLEVYNVTVRNIYLRGMYASSGGTFSFHNNTVTNVRADPASIAMFAYGGGPGIMSNNTVSYANDAISANHSKGIQFLHNTISNSGSGVHTDNAGDGGGVADVIQGNTVTNCDATNGGYGIFVFVPYIAPTVKNNTVTNCLIGLSAWGQGATVMTRFTGNTVTGPGTGVADSVGAYISTDMIGWGYSDVAVSFTGNAISNNATGVLLTADAASWETGPFVPKAIVATFHCDQITGNGKGVDLGTNGTINEDFTYNWWGAATGPTTASNPTGTGDSVADGVTYSPWLMTQACSSVPPYTTGTTITSATPNPSSLGASVTINFNVANIVGSGPVPAGTVDVSDGATVICSAVVLDGSGNGSCTYGFATSGAHALKAVFTPTSTDAFKTSMGTATHTVLSVVALPSIGSLDGWVLESTSTSAVGGTKNSTNISFVLGDDAANRQYRGILYFRTGQVPQNAVITSVTLKIKRLGGSTSNPFSTLGNIVADIKTGVFGSPALGLSDFQAPVSKNAVLTFTNTPSGGWYSQSLAKANFGYINRIGPTQFRLHFAKDSNNNKAADYWTFFSGDALTAANQPQLVIEYYIP